MLNTKIKTRTSPDEVDGDKPGSVDREEATGLLLKLSDAAGQGEPKPEGNPRNNNIWIIVTAACVVFALIGIFGPFGKDAGFIDIDEENVPLAILLLPDETAQPYAGDEETIPAGSRYRIPDYGRLKISADPSHIDIPMFNPEGNTCLFSFEIAMEDTGEVLYTSNLVGPGMCIEGADLRRKLEKGVYRVVVAVSAFDPESLEQADGVRTEITITVD